VLIDAHSHLIVTLVIGRRDTETARHAFADFYRRTDGDLTPLITSQRSSDQSELDALNKYDLCVSLTSAGQPRMRVNWRMNARHFIRFPRRLTDGPFVNRFISGCHQNRCPAPRPAPATLH
jgi:hypothetical protein